jgi:hypothetical protein
MGWCVEGACFKGMPDSRCLKTPDLAFENGDWCLKGISGHYCPAKVGSIDGTAPLVFQPQHDKFVTLDVHAPQTITGILIKSGLEHRPLAFTSAVCGSHYVLFPLTFAPILSLMLLFSRTSPYKGVLWGFIPGMIFCHVCHGLFLLGIALDYIAEIVPSPISTNLTCKTWGAWTIRTQLMLSFSFFLCPPGGIGIVLFVPKYFISICIGLFLIGLAISFGTGLDVWFQWIIGLPVMVILSIFIVMTYILRVSTKRKAQQMTELQMENYERVWALERERTQERRDSESRPTSQRAMDTRSYNLSVHRLERIRSMCSDAKHRFSIKEAHTHRIGS